MKGIIHRDVPTWMIPEVSQPEYRPFGYKPLLRSTYMANLGNHPSRLTWPNLDQHHQPTTSPWSCVIPRPRTKCDVWNWNCYEHVRPGPKGEYMGDFGWEFVQVSCQSVTVKQSCCKSLLFMNNLWAKWQLSKIHIFDIVSICPMYWLDICIFMRIFNKWWAPHLGGQWIRMKPEGRAIVERQLGEAQAPIGCFGCFETPRYGVTDSHTDRHTFEIIYLYLRENSIYKWNCVFFSCWFW